MGERLSGPVIALIVTGAILASCVACGMGAALIAQLGDGWML